MRRLLRGSRQNLCPCPFARMPRFFPQGLEPEIERIMEKHKADIEEAERAHHVRKQETDLLRMWCSIPRNSWRTISPCRETRHRNTIEPAPHDPANTCVFPRRAIELTKQGVSPKRRFRLAV